MGPSQAQELLARLEAVKGPAVAASRRQDLNRASGHRWDYDQTLAELEAEVTQAEIDAAWAQAPQEARHAGS